MKTIKASETIFINPFKHIKMKIETTILNREIMQQERGRHCLTYAYVIEHTVNSGGHIIGNEQTIIYPLEIDYDIYCPIDDGSNKTDFNNVEVIIEGIWLYDINILPIIEHFECLMSLDDLTDKILQAYTDPDIF